MKKILNIKLLSLLLISSLLTISCSDFSEDYRVSPFQTSSVPTSYLLSSAQKDLVGRFLDIADYDGFGSAYAQYIAGKTYTDEERVETEQTGFSNLYAGGMANLQEIINLNTDPATSSTVAVSGANNNQIAVSKILLAWSFMNVSDIWGHAPYTEALKGSQNFSPAYNTQKQIYTGIITDLKDAGNSITTGTIQGDLIYNGDMDKWKKLAGSLLMRAGMRLSNVDATMGSDAFNAGMTIGSFTSNADNAIYAYAGGELNGNPYWLSFTNQNRLDHAVSNTMVDMLGENNDPRLPIYAKPIVSEATTPVGPADFWAKYKVYTVNGQKYAGQPWGYSNDNATELTVEQVSFVGTAFQDEKAPSVLMSFAEVEFLKAEAVARTWISGDAETFYKNGIRASMEQYGVAAADITTYVDTEPFAQYNAANYLKSITEQKWLAMYLQGLNAWAEWRRTGFPALQNATEASEGRAIPRRRAYAQAEFDLNKTNVEAAIAAMGANNTTTKVWWDGGNE
ncbi:SusD/RagB family nutrient-binding outer membrane lipoprotein [Tenacibaculum aiptasiae]|uniref:SusD/RagB family nutrient-binding outer membrane lipoprotein n=1 Tax=Tenacibaculum aiptasiae TaxID=426481 RepID=A0A7J5ACA5_9FLAO|nr:SusD/RagB family nutrient-binding outer membrane lipoprotein [Tenacibaculum aiptasiae]KAB1155204.1 SusD/RagB family nutrient-binding outer membrane lipoprotein [Tenacibaculum aiptasiae]